MLILKQHYDIMALAFFPFHFPFIPVFLYVYLYIYVYLNFQFNENESKIEKVWEETELYPQQIIKTEYEGNQHFSIFIHIAVSRVYIAIGLSVNPSVQSERSFIHSATYHREKNSGYSIQYFYST